MDQLRLRADRDRVPRRVRVRPDGERALPRPRRDARRAQRWPSRSTRSPRCSRRSPVGLRSFAASGSCSARASRPTGRARPRPSPSGSRGARAAGPWRSSTAARRSARALAPFIVLWVYQATGSWRPAFIITGALGFPVAAAVPLALPLARGAPAALAEEREVHPQQPRLGVVPPVTGRRPRGRHARYRTLLSLPQTWGIIIGKALTDPGLVLHHRLVRDLPRDPGLQARGEPAGVLGAVPRRRSRQLLRRRRVELRSSSAAGASARARKHRRGVRRPRDDAADPDVYVTSLRLADARASRSRPSRTRRSRR